ncbi:MAG: T9SS type A sorting domain-containing protein, partial [Muribaculaceae bacterium]|nr:T9SS type A sorting domain-containing protein [Muribaculaceae bacterium]
YLITDSGLSLPIEEVSMLVAADGATDFSVIRKAGTGESINNVTSVSFEIRDIQSAVEDVSAPTISMLLSPVENVLHIVGCAGKEYEIFSINGSKVSGGILADQSSIIELSTLESGVYVLKVNESALKFTKK